MKWMELEERVRPFYENDDPGHDLAHVRRVATTCRVLGETLGADLEVLMPAAYLHDVVNVPKNSPDRAQASRLAAEKARDILAAQTTPPSPERLERILRAIEEHSYSRGLQPTSLEAAILQDADRLDALGAVGAMRTVSCGVKMGAAYYESDQPFAETRALDDRRYTLDHFYVKLLKLEAGMNTEPAKREAARRTAFLRQFLEQLRSEITMTL